MPQNGMSLKSSAQVSNPHASTHFRFLRGEAHHHEGCNVFKCSSVGKKVQLYGGRSVRLESKGMLLMSKEGFDRSFKNISRNTAKLLIPSHHAGERAVAPQIAGEIATEWKL